MYKNGLYRHMIKYKTNVYYKMYEILSLRTL